MGRTGDRGRSSAKDKLVVIVVGCMALLLGLNLFFLLDGGRAHKMVGKEAPLFELPVHGESRPFSLADGRGKVVVLDFWATWCPPCLEQMPALEAIANDPELAEEVMILSVNTDEETEDRLMKIDEFLYREDLSLRTLLDRGEVQSLYGVAAIPALVIIDRQGVVAYRSDGLHNEELLRQKLQPML